MSIIDSIRSWRQDRRMVSMEKHEIDYAKRLALKYLKSVEGEPEHVKRLVRVSSLRRLCKYVLKLRPETKGKVF